MERRTAEGTEALDVRDAGPVEDTDRADEDVAPERL
jgi:hypothetical protein